MLQSVISCVMFISKQKNMVLMQKKEKWSERPIKKYIVAAYIYVYR